jgi:mono/diheme cytochrome c family protein
MMFPGLFLWDRKIFLAIAVALFSARAVIAAPVDFNRQVRPIFSEHCYACHGPDDGKRKAGLRLDREEDAFKELKSGEHAIIAGDLEKSALVKRITTSDEDDIMPPVKHGKPLSKAQIDTLVRWVKEGAKWQKHWAFVPAVRPELPKVKEESWPKNGIDYFIADKLEKSGLKPNPEAEKTALIRRATFDLTGLPPTIEEVDAFLADGTDSAYEKVVDRLMSSPHYGERMAQNWLDLARYADTAGYHFDGTRYMWLWRDWVINSFNKNKPFDQFTVEQLAGDLLPHATRDQKIATGFVRNNMTTDEGGVDPDEYMDKYAADRVSTLGTVWLGMTVGCAQCHDHKFDPIKTKEFYQFYAFFDQVPEKGLDRTRVDNPPPRIAAPTVEQAMKYVELDFKLRDDEKTLQDRINELGERQEKWERVTQERPPAKPSKEGLIAEFSFEGKLTAEYAEKENQQKGTKEPTEGVVVGSNDLITDGRIGKALKLDGKNHLEFKDAVTFERTNAFSYGAWVKFDAKSGTVLSKMEAGPGYRGFDLIYDGKLNVHLVNKWPDNGLKVKTKDNFPQGQWMHVLATYDGSGKASGVKIYVNGKARELEVEKDALKDTIMNSEPLRIGARHTASDFTGSIDEVRFYSRELSAEDARLLTFEGYMPVIEKSRGKRNDTERSDLAKFFKETYAEEYLRAEVAVAKSRKARDELAAQIPNSMIMEDMDPPRDTFILKRGDYRNPGAKVAAGTPAFLPKLEGAANRLSLARWLVTKEQPLTPRVVANRYWALFFGNGIVRTVNDFGSQGEWPSHPELLDWLAAEFRDGAEGVGRPWDVKALVRLIVTSATYRQSAAATPEKLEKDPENRLLSRGPRLRLDAEFIRDNALAVSGLLNDKVGGPSVRPYQPAGIWDGVDVQYVQDHGEKIYRRGMYVFWRRSAHYPSFATFDAPNREVCTFLRQRTHTPLQSLTLMNDPVYVEAARGLAERVMQEESDEDKRLLKAFRHTLGRVPKEDEIAVLKKTYETQRENFKEDAKAADEFLKVGESKMPDGVDKVELAALTATANVLLNLNETITK